MTSLSCQIPSVGERVMKPDALHGRVWLTTLGCDLAAGWEGFIKLIERCAWSLARVELQTQPTVCSYKCAYLLTDIYECCVLVSLVGSVEERSRKDPVWGKILSWYRVHSSCGFKVHVILPGTSLIEYFVVDVSWMMCSSQLTRLRRGSFDVVGGGCPCGSECPFLPWLVMQQVVWLSLFLSFAGRVAAS